MPAWPTRRPNAYHGESCGVHCRTSPPAGRSSPRAGSRGPGAPTLRAVAGRRGRSGARSLQCPAGPTGLVRGCLPPRSRRSGGSLRRELTREALRALMSELARTAPREGSFRVNVVGGGTVSACTSSSPARRTSSRPSQAERLLGSGWVDARPFRDLVEAIPDSAYARYPNLSRASVLDAVRDSPAAPRWALGPPGAGDRARRASGRSRGGRRRSRLPASTPPSGGVGPVALSPPNPPRLAAKASTDRPAPRGRPARERRPGERSPGRTVSSRATAAAG